MRIDNFTANGLWFIRPKLHQRKACYNIREIEVKVNNDEEGDIYETSLVDDEEVEAKIAPKELEDHGKVTIMDELKEINLATKDYP